MLTNAMWGAPSSFSSCVFHRAEQVQPEQATERERGLPQPLVASVQPELEGVPLPSQVLSSLPFHACADPSLHLSS